MVLLALRVGLAGLVCCNLLCALHLHCPGGSAFVFVSCYPFCFQVHYNNVVVSSSIDTHQSPAINLACEVVAHWMTINLACEIYSRSF